MKKASSTLSCKDRSENKNPLHIPLGNNVSNHSQALVLKLILTSRRIGVGSNYKGKKKQ